MTTPPPPPEQPPRYSLPASLEARQGLIHLRMRAPSKEECVICAQCFDVNDVVTTLPCGHMHHSNCILGWLQQKCTCPTCRYELPSSALDDEENTSEETPSNCSSNSSPRQQRKSSKKMTLYNPILGNSHVLSDDDSYDVDDHDAMPMCLADVDLLEGGQAWCIMYTCRDLSVQRQASTTSLWSSQASCRQRYHHL